MKRNTTANTGFASGGLTGKMGALCFAPHRTQSPKPGI